MLNYFKNQAIKAEISENSDKINHYNTLLTRCMFLENQVNDMTDKDIYCPLFVHQLQSDNYLHSRLMTFGNKVKCSSIKPSFAYSFIAHSQEEKLQLIRDYYHDELYKIKDYLLAQIDELTQSNIDLNRTVVGLSKSQARKIITSK